MTENTEPCPAGNRHYTCGACGGHFSTAWDDAKAKAEFEAMRPQYASKAPEGEVDKTMRVCHQCWLAIIEREGFQAPA